MSPDPPPTPEHTYAGPKFASVETFGLRHNALSPIETLAQSVSTIAPSTSPTLTVPLVFVLAGQGTAIAYLIAMGLMLLVGLCIARFARESSSPGSSTTTPAVPSPRPSPSSPRSLSSSPTSRQRQR